MPQSTLRYWVRGQQYALQAGWKTSIPIIILPEKEYPLLSFTNLVEAHILDAIRRVHKIPLQTVRKALDYLEAHFSSKHPLVEKRFETDGLDLFVREYDKLIAISKEGQLAIKNVLKLYLRRIEWDPSGLPIRLYPFTRKRHLEKQKLEHVVEEEPKLIVIDPSISFGRPILKGTRIPTEIIAERYKAGESIGELAHDYKRENYEIEEAIRCELYLKAA